MRASRQRADHGVEHVESAPVPTRLAVGAADDRAEYEADRLAESALALSVDYGDATAVRRAAHGAGGPTDVDAAAVDHAARGGRSLEPDLRRRMEAGFGRSLSGVRVHTGGDAAGVAASIQARAFTKGQDVFFGAGEYRPGTPEGDHVIAHELAHTVQNGPDVHRYPATAMKIPVPWSKQTASVFRPGEGLSGGVYILKTSIPGDPVQKAVAKPVFGSNGLGLRETGEQLVASDRVMAKLLGLRAPESRVVQKGTAEFAELVAVCKPYQPARDPNDDLWAPIEQAESFVVMSEVPNATSVRSLAEKAGTDRRAAGDLYRTLFSDRFLTDLGTMVVGDLLLGNRDRITLGAMNLGNVMVSMQDGRGDLHVIDTSAFLPKAVSPEEIAKYGNTTGGGRSTVVKHLDEGPGQLLDDFFEVVVSVVKRGETAPTGDNPASTVLEQTYRANRDRFLSSFEFGWNDAMITLLALSSDRGKQRMSDALGDSAGELSSIEGLHVNATYLGARAMGGDHGDAAPRAAAINLAAWARDFDRSKVAPTLDDELAPAFRTPDKKALHADWIRIGVLPTPKRLASLIPRGWTVGDDEARFFGELPPAISFAHAEVDQNVSATKTKRSITGKKKVQPRNRNVLGHTVVDSFAVIGGAGRVMNAAGELRRVAEEAQQAASVAAFSQGELAPVKSLLNYFGIAANSLEQGINAYVGSLGKVSSVLPSTTYPERAAIGNIAAKATAKAPVAQGYLTDVRKLQLQRVADHLTARA